GAHRLASRILLGSSVIGVAMLAGEYLLLEPVITLAFGTRYLEAVPAVLILAVQIFFVCRVSLWAWPVIVHRRPVGQFLQIPLLSRAVGQYLIQWLGTGITAGSVPAWVATGHCAHYVLLYAFLQTQLRFDRLERTRSAPDVASACTTPSPRITG